MEKKRERDVCVCITGYAIHLKLTQYYKSTIPQIKKHCMKMITNIKEIALMVGITKQADYCIFRALNVIF